MTGTYDYDLMKSVIVYMDTNQRIETSRCFKAFRDIENLCPLHINELSFEANSITIDGKKYEIKLFIEYPAPMTIETVNHDMDEFGYEVEYNGKVSAGDVFLGISRMRMFPRIYSHEEKIWIERLNEAQKEKDIHQRRANRLDLKDSMRSLHLLSVKNKDTEIVELRKKLIPYQNKKNNQHFTYKQFFQLEISTIGDSSKKIEYYRKPYKINIPKELGTLNDSLLMNRRGGVHVKRLHLSEKVLRFSQVGSKFDVEEVRLCWFHNFNYSSLELFIAPSSFPLTKLSLFHTTIDARTGNHPVVQEAKSLEIWSTQSINTFRNFSNLHISFQLDHFPVNDFVSFVDYWLDNGKTVGTIYNFKFWVEGIAPECLNLVSTKQEVIKKTERLVQLRMRNNSILVVSYRDARNCRNIIELKVVGQ